jgi:DNA-directed RNA polymerase specialized sigma24 family protein
MNSFYRAMTAGRYPQLKDRHDLWRLLLTLTSHKVTKQFRRQRAQKRGGGRVRGESVFGHADETGSPAGIGDLLGRDPTPELIAMMDETCEQMMERLGDDTLKNVALLKLEGLTNREIAERLRCNERTVERKLGLIRKKWEKELSGCD